MCPWSMLRRVPTRSVKSTKFVQSSNFAVNFRASDSACFLLDWSSKHNYHEHGAGGVLCTTHFKSEPGKGCVIDDARIDWSRCRRRPPSSHRDGRHHRHSCVFKRCNLCLPTWHTSHHQSPWITPNWICSFPFWIVIGEFFSFSSTKYSTISFGKWNREKLRKN